MKDIVITKELQQTVKSNSHIDKIYFDDNGRHYFNVHKLVVEKDSTQKQLFGSGIYSHNQIIPGKTNIDKLTEIISKGDPDTLIVKTMTRDEVLEATVKTDENTLAGKFLNSSETEQKQFLSTIGLTPDVLALLANLKNQKPEEPQKPAVKLP